MLLKISTSIRFLMVFQRFVSVTSYLTCQSPLFALIKPTRTISCTFLLNTMLEYRLFMVLVCTQILSFHMLLYNTDLNIHNYQTLSYSVCFRVVQTRVKLLVCVYTQS